VGYFQEKDLFGPTILYLRSTLNTESEYVHIDYDLLVYPNIKNFLIIICRSCDCRSNECRSFKRDPQLCKVGVIF
jgi:hypothetical protein